MQLLSSTALCMLLVLLALSCCRSALGAASGIKTAPTINLTNFDIMDTEIESPRPTEVVASDASDSRTLEFQILGLFDRSRGASPATSASMLLLGSQVVEHNFAPFAYYAGSQLPVTSFEGSEYFFVIIGADLSLDSIVVLATFNESLLSNSSAAITCSMRAALGKQSCNITDTHFVEVEVKERAHLRNCKQAGHSDPAQSCELAHDMDNRLDGPSARCSVTDEGSNPWWQASAVHKIVYFESVGVHASKQLNGWTRNFDISIDRHVACVKVRDGQPFENRLFACGSFGSWIGVVARGNAVRLAICEIAVYGYETGCADWQPQAGSCHGTFVSHIGYGIHPYPPGLECKWTLKPHSRTDRLLLQFPAFQTATDDWVVLYDGVGTLGNDPMSRVLARHHGAGAGYNESRYFGARYYHTTGNSSNYLTVHFTSSRYRDATNASLTRTVESHRGFRMSYTLIKDDFYGEQKQLLDASSRVCYPGRYAARLVATCINRGSINPIFLYGTKLGGLMLRNMEKQFNATGRRPRTIVSVGRMEQALGIMTYRLPEIEADLTEDTRRSLCAAYSGNYVRYIAECCCNSCNMRHLMQYCVMPYEPLTSGCAFNATTLS